MPWMFGLPSYKKALVLVKHSSNMKLHEASKGSKVHLETSVQQNASHIS